MFERLTRLHSQLWPDPARTSLTWWLAAIHLALVLLVGGGITWAASRILHEAKGGADDSTNQKGYD